ncbi:hypothetical protein H1Q59_03415 [Holosporaceae bacterium 'Namur']|nr:hypothetical protein [Holosporaceae bacterium 'Namur']
MKNYSETESYNLIVKAIKGELKEKEFEKFNNLCKSIPLYNFYTFAMSVTDLMSDKALHLLIEGIIKEVEILEKFPLHSNERLKALMSEEAKRYNYKVIFDEQHSTFPPPHIPKTVPNAILAHFKTILDANFEKIKISLEDGSIFNYVTGAIASVLNGLYLEYNEKFSKGFGNLILQIAARDAQVKYKVRLQGSSRKYIMSKLGLDSEDKIIPNKKKLKLLLDNTPKCSKDLIEGKVNQIIELFLAKKIKLAPVKSSLSISQFFSNLFHYSLNRIKSIRITKPS